MHPAPVPNDDEMGSKEDKQVADPLSDETVQLWNETARENRQTFTDIFRPVPTDLVHDWKQYGVCSRLPIARWKYRLITVFTNAGIRAEGQDGPRPTGHQPRSGQGAPVACPRSASRDASGTIRISIRLCLGLTTFSQDFLIDQKDFVENAAWSTYNPTLPVYI